MSETRRLWRTWPLAFEEAGKCAPEPRVTYDLPPGQFGLALRSLDHDHAGLASGDARYQAACALGHLTWYDERGRCVVLVRHGSLVSQYQADGTAKGPAPIAPPATDPPQWGTVTVGAPDRIGAKVPLNELYVGSPSDRVVMITDTLIPATEPERAKETLVNVEVKGGKVVKKGGKK